MARMTKKDKEFFEKVIENIYNELRCKFGDHLDVFNSRNSNTVVKILTKLSELKKEDQKKVFNSPCWKSVKDPYIYYSDRKNLKNIEYSKLQDNFKNSFKSTVGHSIIRRGQVDKEFREFLLDNADGALLKWLIQSKEIATTMTKESANKIFDRVKNASILKNLIKIAPYDSVVYGFKNYKGKDKRVIIAFRDIIGYSDVTEENALSYVLSQPQTNVWAFINTVYNCGFASKAKQEDITTLINFVKEKEWGHWHLQRFASYLFAFCTKQTIYSNLFFFKTNCPESLALKLDLKQD
jgi:hypothetical protein